MTLVLPTLDEVNQPFWDACRDGVLQLQRCRSCGHLRYPISTVCHRCLSTSADWEPLSGTGEIFSFVIFRHAYNEAWRERLPYNVALVELSEGPVMISNIAGAEPEELSVGLPVRAVFEPLSEEITVPRFELRREGEHSGREQQ